MGLDENSTSACENAARVLEIRFIRALKLLPRVISPCACYPIEKLSGSQIVAKHRKKKGGKLKALYAFYKEMNQSDVWFFKALKNHL